MSRKTHPCQLSKKRGPRYACTIGGVSTKTSTGTNLAFASIYGALKVMIDVGGTEKIQWVYNRK